MVAGAEAQYLQPDLGVIAGCPLDLVSGTSIPCCCSVPLGVAYVISAPVAVPSTSYLMTISCGGVGDSTDGGSVPPLEHAASCATGASVADLVSGPCCHRAEVGDLGDVPPTLRPPAVASVQIV
jgi:hypothetical protein